MLDEPKAYGPSSGENIPVVPVGGMPCKVAVPLPLSVRLNQDGNDDCSETQLTGVMAPEDVSTTELGTPAMNVAEVGGPKLASGAEATLIVKDWGTVP